MKVYSRWGVSRSLSIANPVEVPQDCIIERIGKVIALLFSENMSEFEYVFYGERWNEGLDQFKAVNVLVSLFLRKNGWLIEASEAINELFKGRLIALAVAVVLSFTEFF